MSKLFVSVFFPAPSYDTSLTHCLCFIRQVDQFSDEDVQQDPKIVGVEVFLSARGGEQEVEDFEDE